MGTVYKYSTYTSSNFGASFTDLLTVVAVPVCCDVQLNVYVVSAVIAAVVCVPLVPASVHESPADDVILHEPDTMSVPLQVSVVPVPFFTVAFAAVSVSVAD
jgi:hypothetical protein